MSGNWRNEFSGGQYRRIQIDFDPEQSNLQDYFKEELPYYDPDISLINLQPYRIFRSRWQDNLQSTWVQWNTYNMQCNMALKDESAQIHYLPITSYITLYKTKPKWLHV